MFPKNLDLKFRINIEEIPLHECPRDNTIARVVPELLALDISDAASEAMESIRAFLLLPMIQLALVLLTGVRSYKLELVSMVS